MASIMDELSKPNPEKKVAPPMNIESKVRILALVFWLCCAHYRM
jgi:hypothetical protein